MFLSFLSLILVSSTERSRASAFFICPAKGKVAPTSTKKKTTSLISISSTCCCFSNAKTNVCDTNENEKVPPSHVFIGGLGYCGIRIAAAFRAKYPECKISGCVRSNERKMSMLKDSAAATTPAPLLDAVHVFDLDESYTGLDNDGIADLLQASHIIQTIAPIADLDRDPLLALHGNQLIENGKKSNDLKWVGYLSSTGVYGNHDGKWVTEESELRCVDRKSLARVEAEREWRLFEKHLNEEKGENDTDDTVVQIDCFRCGGIYGPGRGPLFSTAAKKTAASPISSAPTDTATTKTTVGPPKYVNRILVDDICGALLAAVSSNRPSRHTSSGRVYNLVDDDPAPRAEVTEEANRLRGIAESSNTSSVRATNTDKTKNSTKRVTRSRNTGNKRCQNQRLKDDCGWKLKAPTFREGLALLLENEERI